MANRYIFPGTATCENNLQEILSCRIPVPVIFHMTPAIYRFDIIGNLLHRQIVYAKPILENIALLVFWFCFVFITEFTKSRCRQHWEVIVLAGTSCFNIRLGCHNVKDFFVHSFFSYVGKLSIVHKGHSTKGSILLYVSIPIWTVNKNGAGHC